MGYRKNRLILLGLSLLWKKVITWHHATEKDLR
jgi:hypothetical protein